MAFASKQDLQHRENKIMALITSVSQDDPELAESLKQTLSIIKHSHFYQTGLTRAVESDSEPATKAKINTP